MDVYVAILLIAICSVSCIVFGWLIRIFYEKKKLAKTDEEVIISQVNESTERGFIEESEALMISNIFEFGDKVAKDIMTDRTNIVAIDSSIKLKDAIELMLNNSYSRFPVYEENIDKIIGILHLKDAISVSREKTNNSKQIGNIDDLLREAVFIPETRKVDILFSAMRAKRYHMVIVVDEYGQTAGIVAMRDILEEIVGDIDDEYDDEDDYIVAREDNKYVIEGLTKLEDLEEYLSIKFEDDNFETINGFMISKMEHIPDKKEKFEYNYMGYLFKVLSVENNMIKQILVTKAVEDKEETLEE